MKYRRGSQAQGAAPNMHGKGRIVAIESLEDCFMTKIFVNCLGGDESNNSLEILLAAHDKVPCVSFVDEAVPLTLICGHHLHRMYMTWF